MLVFVRVFVFPVVQAVLPGKEVAVVAREINASLVFGRLGDSSRDLSIFAAPARNGRDKGAPLGACTEARVGSFGA